MTEQDTQLEAGIQEEQNSLLQSKTC